MNDGGPAFSRPYSYDIDKVYPAQAGMTLLEYYAGEALKLFLLSKENVEALLSGAPIPRHDIVASFCFDLAEEMIAERNRRMKK